MPQNYLYSYAQTIQAEETIPSMSYRELVENLGRLTEVGALAPGNPAGMLVAARLVDRARIERSGMSAAELECALERYRARRDGVFGIVKALEQACRVASPKFTA